MRLFGQTFTAGIIERNWEVVSAQPELTRSELSRRVCDWLGWQAPNGKAREVSSRKVLLALQRQGLIALPAPPQARPAAPAPAAALSWTAPVFTGPLAQLGAPDRWRSWSRSRAARTRGCGSTCYTYHPLGGGPLCGAQQRYLIRSPVVGWLGALAFSAAARFGNRAVGRARPVDRLVPPRPARQPRAGGGQQSLSASAGA